MHLHFNVSFQPLCSPVQLLIGALDGIRCGSLSHSNAPPPPGLSINILPSEESVSNACTSITHGIQFCHTKSPAGALISALPFRAFKYSVVNSGLHHG